MYMPISFSISINNPFPIDNLIGSFIDKRTMLSSIDHPVGSRRSRCGVRLNR